MPLPIGVQEWAGGAGPGHGAGLLAARLSTPGATVDDLPTRERKKMLESGSNLNAFGQLAGGAIGAGLGAALSGDPSIGGEVWNGIAGASTGALVGGVAAPAVGGWWNARQRLKAKAEEKAAPIRAQNERLEEKAMKTARGGGGHGGGRGGRGRHFGHTLTVETNDAFVDELSELLHELRRLGSAGASRSIHIEDGLGRKKFYMDGDGADRIGKITVDGEDYHFAEKTAEATDADDFWATELAATKTATLDPAAIDNSGMRTRMGYYRWRAMGSPVSSRPVGPVDMGNGGENGTASPGSPNMSGINAV